MIKACIFDLDGTLVNTLESMSYVANGVLREFSLKPLPTENFKYYCGEGASVLVRKCLKAAGDDRLEFYEEAEKLYRRRFDENPLYKLAHYPQVPEMLAELKKRGMKLGVCSNKPDKAAKKVIEAMFGEHVFDMVLGQQSGIPRKPAPDGPLMLAEKFGVKAGECMYIGDSGTDMQTGTAAGMLTVGVLWGFRDAQELKENGAMALAENPSELLDIQCRIR